MSFLWIKFVVALLCFNLQLEIVVAGNKTFGPKNIHDWREASHGVGTGDFWTDLSNPDRLSTILEPNSESWFFTPVLQQFHVSHLDITAMPTTCDGENCDLKIYGNETSVSHKLPDPTDRKFIQDNFELITTVTFPRNKRQLMSVLIKKPYQRLCIRTTPATNKRTTWNIYSLKLYYSYCVKTTINKIDLSYKNSSESEISVNGSCTLNTISKDGRQKITVRCSPQGEWIVGRDQKCLCKKGFGSDSSKSCSPCQLHFYKNIVSDAECVQCPKGKTNNTMNTNCQCLEDRYTGEDKNGPCYAVPSKVEGLQVKIARTFVHVSWSRPLKVDGPEQSLKYRVECYHDCNHSKCDKEVNNTVFPPRETNFTTTLVNVSYFRMNETYKFKIVSILNSLTNVSSDKWKYAERYFTFKIPENPSKSATTKKSTGETEDPKASKEEKDDSVLIYIGAGAAFFVIVLLIILIIIIKLRRTKTCKGADNHGFDIALPTIGQRTYIDPSNYHDPEVAVREFANEISPKALILERVLGGGEFGDVYKGTLKTETGGVIEVAAKTLKHDSDERSRKDFFMEASAMGQFKDLNVIHLEGVITKSVPHMIITEYMSNGSLDNFLQQNDGNLTVLQLVGMARGVASGMKYLADMNFVHRDLAARNILVNEMLLCKVADFGLSRELENADSSRGEYCASGGKIPVRWTAPEAINYRKFSTASDVWSYGILLWEIMAFAERPYGDWDNFKVLERVDNGYRLPAPKNCPKAVHELMLGCWDTDRNQRPQFKDIVKMLDDWLKPPETIKYEKIKRPASGGVSDTSILIKEWLNDIKMSSYIANFTQAGFIQLSDLAGLLESDLEAIGINLIGHRNKMLRTIRTLPITNQSKKSSTNGAASLKV